MGHQLGCVQEAGIQSAVREAFNGDSITKQIHKLTRPRTIYEKQVCSLRAFEMESKMREFIVNSEWQHACLVPHFQTGNMHWCHCCIRALETSLLRRLIEQRKRNRTMDVPPTVLGNQEFLVPLVHSDLVTFEIL